MQQININSLRFDHFNFLQAHTFQIFFLSILFNLSYYNRLISSPLSKPLKDSVSSPRILYWPQVDYYIVIKLDFSLMKHGSGSQSEDSMISPGAFIADLQYSSSIRERLEKPKNNPVSKSYSQNLCRLSVYDSTKTQEKSEKKRLAGLKSRVKKQKQLTKLQQNVSMLSTQIEQCQREISKYKDELVEAIKLSMHSSSQHAFTMSQMERLIKEEEIDLDQVNLLLDIIQSRIGANGKERQSKLQYNFKQIINSLFPALHRYLMYSAVHNKDLFYEPDNQIKINSHPVEKWTKILYEDVNLSQKIVGKIVEKKSNFINKRYETIQLISKLKKIKNDLKNQEETIQNAMTHIREQMNPIQSSHMILFGEKNKLRRQFLFLDEIFVMQSSPSKHLKLQ